MFSIIFSNCRESGLLPTFLTRDFFFLCYSYFLISFQSLTYRTYHYQNIPPLSSMVKKRNVDLGFPVREEARKHTRTVFSGSNTNRSFEISKKRRREPPSCGRRVLVMKHNGWAILVLVDFLREDLYENEFWFVSLCLTLTVAGLLNGLWKKMEKRDHFDKDQIIYPMKAKERRGWVTG